MSTENRPTRKGEDVDIVRLNALGLSLKTIGNAFGMHPTSVSQRLRSLGIKPADTRRAFAEDIVLGLSDDQAVWLADQLGPGHTLQDFLRNLIIEAYVSKRP